MDKYLFCIIMLIILRVKWMKLRDFTKETDLIELVNRYGKFLEENKLELNKSLSRLLIDLKDNYQVVSL